MSWDDIVGHEAIKAYLRRLIKSGRVAHAYALVGREGIGKTLMALVFAQALLCPATRDGAPCGECRACRMASRGQHPDLHLLAPDDGVLGIEKVRELQRELALKPYAAERKIAVIDGADALTVAAQNCLLKTLEEPPGNTVILLVAENAEALLATVRSRCQLVRLQPLPTADVTRHLVGLGVSEAKARLAARLSGGSLKAALAAVERDYLAMRERVAGWIDALAARPTGLRSVLLIGEELEKERERVDEYLNLLFLWLRDLLLVQEGADAGVANQDTIERLKAQARALPLPGIARALGEVDRARARLKANANFRLTVDVMLTNLRRSLVL